MGYYSTAEGRIEVRPPLTYGEAKRVVEPRWEWSVNEEGTALLPPDDTFKAYCFDKHLAEIVDDLAGHVFLGSVRVTGEEFGDVWDLKAEGRVVLRQKMRVEIVEDGPEVEV